MGQQQDLQGLVAKLRAVWYQVNSFDFSFGRIGRFLSSQPSFSLK